MKKYFRWSIVLQIVLQIFQVACSMGFILAGKQLVDIATGRIDEALAPYVALLVGTRLLQLGINAMKSYVQSKSELKMKIQQREKMFDHILFSRLDLGEKKHSADVVSRLQEDIRVLSEAVCRSLPATIGAVLHFVAAFFFLLYFEPKLAWFVAIFTPIGILVGRYLMYKTRSLTHDIRNSETDIQTHLQESLQHLTTIKAMDYDTESKENLDHYQQGLDNNTMRKTRFSIVSNVILGFVFAVGYLAAFLWGVQGLQEGVITYGVMTAFLQLVGQVQRPVMDLSHHLPNLMKSVASIDRLKEIEQLPQELRSGKPHLLKGATGIRIQNLEFAYKGKDNKIFNDFSCDFKPGSVTAITGSTGIGKTTLIKLILNLQYPDKGSIKFYNDIEEVEACPDTRCNLAYVPQGNSLLNGSIRYNLLIGNPSATEDMLRSALHAAAADFVFDLPEGMDTDCFERGEGLSEGQAQRVAVARALLRPGNILLLDEFSSALDHQTEDLLMKNIAQRAQEDNLTVIMITHRTDILKYCTQNIRL